MSDTEFRTKVIKDIQQNDGYNLQQIYQDRFKYKPPYNKLFQIECVFQDILQEILPPRKYKEMFSLHEVENENRYIRELYNECINILKKVTL